MGVLLSMQETDVHIPEFEVSIGAAGHEHLATGREAAGHNTGLAHCAAAAQCLGGEVPEGHGTITGPCQQEGGVGCQRAHSERTAARVLQRRGRLTCLRAPHDGGPICGAAEQVPATRAEAAAVNPVAVARQRREGKLREVSGVINSQSLVTGGGRQERWREGTAADLVRVVSKSANY